jgi:dihydroorotate dehydrogenase electron transfer subunit
MSNTARPSTVDAVLRENIDVGASHRLMTLDAPAAADLAVPGQFGMLSLLGSSDPLLPRPVAILDADRSQGTVRFLLKTVGRGTKLIADLVPGERMRLLAPLGRPWRLQSAGRAYLVAGGTGFAAMFALAQALAANGVEVHFVWGQACDEAFPDSEHLDLTDVTFECSTDDGSRGYRGNSVECLADAIGTPSASQGDCLYGAGPLPMLRALAGLARTHSLPCQVSLEARMACGIGVCRGCIVNARDPHPHTGLRRRTVCKDGPVFDAHELDWDDLQ